MKAFHRELRAPLSSSSWLGSQGAPTIEQAQEVVAWSLALVGQNDGSLLDDVQERVARRHEKFWDLYRSALHAFPPQQEGRAREVIQQLAACFELLRLSEAVRRNVLTSHEVLSQPLEFGSTTPIHCSQIYLSLLSRWFGPSNPSKKPERLHLILYLLDRAVAKRYRRRDLWLCEEQRVRSRGLLYGTRFWKNVIEMDKFMYEACQKELNEYFWGIVAKSSDQGKSFVQTLEKMKHKELAEIAVQQHLVSYQNGILDLSTTMPSFTPYDSPDFAARYPPNIATSVFIPQSFDTGWMTLAQEDWFQIPTPLFQHLLDYQDGGKSEGTSSAAEHTFKEMCQSIEAMTQSFEQMYAQKKREASVKADPEEQRTFLLSWLKESFSCMQRETEKWNDQARLFYEDLMTPGKEDLSSQAEVAQHIVRESFPQNVQRWLYILLGRLLFPLGQHDDWQVIPFLKGTAGTGKSSIAAIVQDWFAPEDRGIVTVNCEKTFGLQSLVGKRVWFMTEVKRNMNNFSQAD
ncbi:MAG: hypothetical protein EBZ48_08435, partial [Proteobacteria bacterium]|nr:hypothetical protein [Pseudomonadota bacterium]